MPPFHSSPACESWVSACCVSGVVPLKLRLRDVTNPVLENVSFTVMDAGVYGSLAQLPLMRWGCKGSLNAVLRNATLEKAHSWFVPVKLAATAW